MSPSAEDALQKLMAGNRRYTTGISTHPHQTSAYRQTFAKTQNPFATILTCSDSRVPPTVIFDQGLGDLFVVRVAGNIVGDLALGSIEYAVEHLDTKLIVVLGHSRCGAVTAALENVDTSGHLHVLVEAIKPAVEAVRGQPGDPLDNAIRANVHRVVEQIQTADPILSERVQSGQVKIIGAHYDLDSGAVECL